MLKKLIMLALVLALTVCVLVACGGETETGAPETNVPETQAPETEPKETEHVHDLAVEDVAATCQTRGYHKETCKTCGEVVVENAYPKTACTPVAAATCTDDSVCSACGEVVEKATGHSFGEAVVVAATCKAEGSSTKTCATCGESEVTALAIVAHNIPDENVTASTESTACGVPGSKTGTCTLCNESVTVELPGLAHAFTLNEAVYAEDGTITIPCTACGENVTISTETKLALTFDGATVEEEFDALGLGDMAALVNVNGAAQIKEVDGKSVLFFKTAKPLWIDVDPMFLNDASYYMVSFDYRVNKDVESGTQISLFGALPGAANGTGAKGFNNIAKYDRSTGWLKHGTTNNATQYFEVTTGQFYHIDILVNNVGTTGAAYLFVDGEYICTVNGYAMNEENGTKYSGNLAFRISEDGNTHDPLYDNFSISVVR